MNIFIYRIMSIILGAYLIISSGIAGGTNEIGVSSKSPDNKSKIYGTFIPRTPEKQKLYIENGIKGIEKVIVESTFRYPPKITWHGNEDVEVMIVTGSPGRFSIFYDLVMDSISSEMWFVLGDQGVRTLEHAARL